jgi:RNase P protein component
MGYELRREIREALGPNVTGLQRAVALEIADDARHDADGRRSRASLKDLARWTGAKDTAVVRNALKRLAEAGWEFRVAIGKGKDGRVLYATPGHAMEFRVPYPPEGAPAHSEGATAHSDAEQTEGATAHSEEATAPSEGATAHSEGAVATPPSQITTHIPTTSADADADQLWQQDDVPPPAATKKPRKTSAKKPNAHPVADELTNAFWEKHGKGRAQPYIAVRSVIRTAIGNGVERNDLARALDLVAREGRSISGATLDIALGRLRGHTGRTPYRDPENQDDYDQEVA